MNDPLRRLRSGLLAILLLAGCAWVAPYQPLPQPATSDLELAVPNDNRTPGGTLRDGVLALHLETRLAAWRPDLDVDTSVSVYAFAEPGSAPRIPGPLLRTPQGTEVRISVRNTDPDSTLVVHGLRAGTAEHDTLQVPPGAAREVRYHAGSPGTYLYWGTTSGRNFDARSGRDAQLTGAIVIDPADTPADAADRIFVITLIDILPDSTRSPPLTEDIWEIAVNGLSWPHTERLAYPVGDTARWRWINGSDRTHPMHLHGFHFRVLAKGDGHRDTLYAAGAERLAVTEFMLPASTFEMEWLPTRPGNWLMHCHMLGHIVPFPERPDSLRGHDLHDVAGHPLQGMAGLVVGITTFAADGSKPQELPRPARRLRLFAQQAPAESGSAVPHGYVLQQEDEPLSDSVAVPGSVLVLTRGETTAITVVNRLREPTTVHWHGMELESVFDGVAGWSGVGSNLAPLIAPGDSFTVAFTPPRAGTYIYHTHMEEGAQLPAGLYGPLLVLDPDESYDALTDLLFVVGGAVEGGKVVPAINGRSAPEPLELRAGTHYRLRIINILPHAPVRVELLADSLPLAWRHIAKDGADLPEVLQVEAPARLRIGVGETYDFEWTPQTALHAELLVRLPDDGPVLRQPVRIRP